MNDLPRSLKHVTVWLLVLTAVFLAVQYGLHRQGQTRVQHDGDTLRIRRSADGHFYWPGQIQGQPVQFLIDTGATRTALPLALAQQLALPVGRPVQSSTAGGTVQGHMSRADVVLQGGITVASLNVTVLPALGSPLLGMDVLGRLRLTQEDGVLTVMASAPGDQAGAR